MTLQVDREGKRLESVTPASQPANLCCAYLPPWLCHGIHCLFLGLTPLRMPWSSDNRC